MASHLKKFRIEAERLKDGPTFHDIDMDPAVFELTEDFEYSFEQPVVGEVKASLAGHDVLLQGKVSTTAKAQCGRCLEPVEIKLEASITAIYITDERLKNPAAHPELDDGNSFYYDGDIVYPAEQIRESLLLQLPPTTSCELDNDNICPIRNVEVPPMVFGEADSFARDASEEDQSLAAQMKKLRNKIED